MFSYILNFYDFLLLTTVVLAVLYIIPLLIKRDIEKSDILLCAFLISQGLISLNIVFLHNETLGPQTIQKFVPFHAAPLTFLYGIQGFLLLWYMRAMMGESIRFFTKGSILSGGIILLAIAQGINILAGLEEITKPYLPYAWEAAIISIFPGVYALKQLKQYDNRIRLRFSSIENINLSWLWYCGLGFVCVWAITIMCYALGSMGYHELANQLGTFKNLPPIVLMSIMVVYSQTLKKDASDRTSNIPARKEKEDKPFTVSDEKKAKLDDLMLRVKIYQDPELRLDGLADCMDMSARSVSALLNGYYQKNFYDFINYYRVLDAQEQLRNTRAADKTIQRIFEDAGFNSKTTFNTLFKKLTGHTPSEYRKIASVLEVK